MALNGQLSIYLCLFVYVYVVLTSCHASSVNKRRDYGYNQLQDLFQNLTDPDVYRRWARPMGNCHGERSSQNGLQVNISIELYNYATIHEQTSEYTFQFFLDLNWCDERLIADFSSLPTYIDEFDEGYRTEDLYNLMEGSTYHIDRIWRPNIFVPNNEAPGSIDSDIVSSNSMRVDLRTGRVWIRKRKMLNVNCKMDFSFFPFDQQECYVHFQASVDNVRNLKLRWGDTIRVKNPFRQRMPEQELAAEAMNWAVYRHDSFRTMGFRLPNESIKLSNSQSLGISGLNFSRCTFSFVLEREFTHYLITAYFPSALIVVVSWSEFWLEITSPPARVMLGVSTMLALLTTFKSAKEQLSSISYMNVMDIWNLVCTIFIVLIVMEFALVNYIYNTEKRATCFRRLQEYAENYRRAQESRSRTATFHNEPIMEQQSSFDEPDPPPESNWKQRLQLNHLKETLLKAISLKRFHNKKEELDPDHMNKSRTSSVSFVSQNPAPATPNINNNNNNNNNYTPEYTPGQRRPSTFSGIQHRRTILQNRQNTFSGNVPNSGTNSRRQSGSPSVAFKFNPGRRRTVCIRKDVDVQARLNMTPEQLALSIDRKCAYIFPGAFFLFNIAYWTIIFTRSRIVF